MEVYIWANHGESTSKHFLGMSTSTSCAKQSVFNTFWLFFLFSDSSFICSIHPQIGNWTSKLTSFDKSETTHVNNLGHNPLYGWLHAQCHLRALLLCCRASAFAPASQSNAARTSARARRRHGVTWIGRSVSRGNSMGKHNILRILNLYEMNPKDSYRIQTLRIIKSGIWRFMCS